jgi:hypothetical protein
MRILALSIPLALVACGPDSRGNSGGPEVDASTSGGADGQNVDMSRVYAHSGTTLYRIDTMSLQAIQIGTMTGLGTQSLTDLAVDKADNMVGITLNKLYSIDATNGTVTLIKDLPQNAQGLTSLSFIPTDLNDPNSADILVSANDQGNVFQIDPSTGSATMLGSYGTVAAGKVISSGDLIGVRGLGIYATVDVGTEPNDYLAQIDPVTWKATPIGTGTGYNNIFGLAFWGGTIYGFVDDMGAGAGKIITIDPSTGAGHEVLGGSIRWYGAGTSTDAPLLQ